MLLASAWQRLLVVGVVLAALWASVLWVAPSTPSTAPAQPSVTVAPASVPVPATTHGALRVVAQSDLPAPCGGRFDRFDVPGQPVVAPVNARGQVTFYASVLRAPGREGIFRVDAGRIDKVAAFIAGNGSAAKPARVPPLGTASPNAATLSMRAASTRKIPSRPGARSTLA